MYPEKYTSALGRGFLWPVNMRWVVAIIVILLTQVAWGQGVNSQPQAVYSKADRQQYDVLYAALKDKRHLPTNQLLVEVAKAMLGTPYVHNPIEPKDGKEKLVGNLKAVDCVTFVDNALALTWALKQKNPSFEAYLAELQPLRYHSAQPKGYADRFHYMTHLLRTQEKRSRLKIMGSEVGAVPYKKDVNFMTKRVKQYPYLKDSSVYRRVAAVERQLTNNPSWYIPKKDLPKQASRIKDGDVLAITASRNGLDVCHMGLAMWKNNQLYLVHASMDFKKVMVSTKPLVAYMSNKKNQGGLMVARLVN